MKKLNITKSDIKFLLIFASFLPTFGFVLGFYVASSQNNYATTDIVEQSPLPEKQTLVSEAKEIETNISQTIANKSKNSDESNKIVNTQPISVTNTIEEKAFSGKYVLQAGLFSNASNAVKYSSSLMKKGLDVNIVEDRKLESPVYRVTVGTFDSEEKAIQELLSIEERYSLNLHMTKLDKVNDMTYVAAL